MNVFFDGIKVGLILCFLLGPIFFTLVQTSVEEGGRAGLIVGTGIWTSDFLYISAVYWGIAYIQRLTQMENFTLYTGILGGAILLSFGLFSLVTKPKFHSFSHRPSRTSSIFSLFSKGLLINGINPFTVFFWVGIATISGSHDPQDAYLYFGGILFTIVVTDMIKILLAKRIRQRLKPMHVLGIRRITGIALIIFGVVLFIRVLI